MNRRSLLLGGVVASVAGILRVKARPVEVAATPARIQWEPIEEIYPAIVPESFGWVDFEVAKGALYNTPEYKALLIKRVMENLGDQVSGYQVNQLMAHGTPPMSPEPQFITEKYAQTMDFDDLSLDDLDLIRYQTMYPPYRRDPSGAVYPVDEADYTRLRHTKS